MLFAIDLNPVMNFHFVRTHREMAAPSKGPLEMVPVHSSSRVSASGIFSWIMFQWGTDVFFLVNHWFVFGHQYTQFSDKSEVIIPAKSTEGFHLFFSINKNYRYFEDQGAS